MTAEQQQRRIVQRSPGIWPPRGGVGWRLASRGVVAGASAPGMPAAPHASPSSPRVMPPPPTMRNSRRRKDFFDRVYGLFACLRQDVGQRLHGGHPRLVAGCQLQRLPGLGARRAHRLRHLAEFGVVRAGLCAASQLVRRAAGELARRLHSGVAYAQLQQETGGLSSCRCQGCRHPHPTRCRRRCGWVVAALRTH